MQYYRALLDALPATIKSHLDVGCGSGVFATLSRDKERFVVGVDLSEAGLSLAAVEKCRARAASLPFRDCSFDVVSCIQVFEHLDDSEREAASREIARVARGWVLLGVPYREQLLFASLRCYHCGHLFHSDGHVCAFNKPGDVTRLFPDFRAARIFFAGKTVTPRLRMRGFLRKHFLQDWRAIFGETTCPKCGGVIPQGPYDRKKMQTASRPVRYIAWRLALLADNVLGPALRRLGCVKDHPFWMAVLLSRKRDSGRHC